MNQRESIPGSQRKRQTSLHSNSDNNTTSAQPYRASARRQTSGMPKSEHPSSYNESPPPYSYHAQDNLKFTQQDETTRDTRRFSPDGDAFETRYHSYSQYSGTNQNFPWTRPKISQWSILKWVFIALGALTFIALTIIVASLALSILIFAAFFTIVGFVCFTLIRISLARRISTNRRRSSRLSR